MPPKDFPQCFYSSAAEFLARSGLLPIKHIYISTNAISILLSRTASISSSSANYTAYTTKPQFGQVLRGRLLNKVENLTKLHQLVLCLRLEFRTKGAFGQKPARRKLNQNLNCNPESLGTSAAESSVVSVSLPHVGRQTDGLTHTLLLHRKPLCNHIWVTLKYIFSKIGKLKNQIDKKHFCKGNI